jgi:antitoxin YefM
MAISADEAGRRLVSLIQAVNDDQIAVEIVSNEGNAFLVSADEYRSLKETVYLLRSPANAARLRESLDEVGGAGRTRASQRDMDPPR